MIRRTATRLLTLTVGIALSLAGCGGNSGSSETQNKEEDSAVPVEVATVGTGDISAYFTGTATLEAEEETDVVAKVGGVVEEIFAEEGDHVDAGQVLARLDGEKLAFQVEQEKANFLKLESEFRRSQELFDRGLISDEEFQAKKYEYEFQKEAYNLARLDLEYTSIRAPIAGVIAERMIKVGNMVLLNEPTFRITGLEPLLAMLYVPEQHVNRLKVGQQTRLTVDAMEGEAFTGRIERISPVIDPTTGTVKATIAVQDSSGRLKPGMFARISITYDIHANTLLVPKDAIITEDRESAVFVVRDSIAFRREVRTGYVNADRIEVLTGLEPGEMVVTTGKGSLRDSARVELVSNEAVTGGKTAGK
jgi:membrane fusion protein (multidrug efflux system)